MVEFNLVDLLQAFPGDPGGRKDILNRRSCHLWGTLCANFVSFFFFEGSARIILSFSSDRREVSGKEVLKVFSRQTWVWDARPGKRKKIKLQ